ncbi:MAG: UvrD-helicase domain-containing protein [Bacteroidota bacterium]|nr:UvrD-helicase domain-containing protein [Bacteroidota bacterium]
MDHYLKDLNSVQRAAVEAIDGPVMVIAGPGSGKTRVLTMRLAHLIQLGVKPYNVLALTFTNKAAKEMTERISQIIGPSARKIWSGTFHSIFARILRVEGPKIGFPSQFSIYDTDDSKSLITEIIKELQLNTKDYNPNSIRSRISSAKSNLITPVMYERDPVLIDQDKLNRMPLIAQIYKRYVQKCLQSGAMDFDDLLLQLFRLFQENPENVLEKYRHQFQYILVDEFQDTNYLQYAIIKKLCHYTGSKRNVCIVGDDAQSIYSFRGATINNILDFEKDFPDVKVFKLEQNYRSTDHIVQAANDVITYNDKQIKKEIWTEKKEGNKIKLLKSASDSEEGRRVADYIVELKNRYHLPNKEIAILYRVNAQSRIFEEQLRRVNIPYKVFGGMSFYQRKEIKDMIAYLRLCVNSKDNEALKRIINYPKRGIGESTLEKFIEFANTQEMSIWEALQLNSLSGRAGNAVQGFILQIKEIAQYALKANAYDAALYAFKLSGLSSELKQDITNEGINRIENVMALLDGIKEFTEQDEVDEDEYLDRSLVSYLQSISLITEMDTADNSMDYITLMSVHAAKGLEFEAILVGGMEENLFPSYLSMNSREQQDEERRLFYVAITRAKRFLTLSYASTRYMFGNLRMNQPSRFLDEIQEDRFEFEKPLRSGMQLWNEAQGPRRILVQRKPTEVDSSQFKDFTASPSNDILPGMKVLHLKFGKGEVISIDGSQDNRIATIYFKEVDNPSRKIMLKFAKLQVLPA